ncbi:DUF4352 domain-containing protein [Pseudoclavibacter sp. Z016]|uniref:DUF4352 domain-containing protein n=1 Tax=Pseudoclavibacter sp. Z016 TaxID=2080581 RepID=UPI000CE78838|nr:DUF4352 domain-containing protein [Pseudoclavibacter sp. Z016]PPF77159.1 hypothetical protein C5B99_04120 [Pseudoclavibacter sp. Z016]
MSMQPPAPHYGHPNQPQQQYFAPAPVVQPRTTSAISWTALGFGITGMLAAIIPGVSFFAWIFTLVALVLAIVGLAQKHRAKAVAGVSLGLSTVAFVTAVIVSMATLGSAGTEGAEIVAEPEIVAESAAPAASVEEPETTPEAQPEVLAPVGIGQTVTGHYGVTFTVDAVTCGMTSYSYASGYLEETALGQFCEIRFTTFNGSTSPFDFYSDSVSGTIGDAYYEAESSLSTVGEDSWFSTVNPGLTVSGVTVIDIPVGAQLETVHLQTNYFNGQDIVVQLV